MSEIINVNDNSTNRKMYDIVLSDGFQELSGFLKPFLNAKNKVCIISDSNVAPLYSDLIKNIISETGCEIHSFTFDAGEKSKTLDTVKNAYQLLIEDHFERNDVLIALGGGVTGDLTGFIASTYLRGIKFIQIPTSLLAQTDSSIGGKTGVDFESYKNMVGTFYQPSLCYINPEVLTTLDDRQFLSGLAEVIKAALIKDAEFFSWIVDNKTGIINKDRDIIEEMIKRACLIKRSVVEEDVNEAGIRAHLNFGHTIGHSIEKNLDFKLLHGECVLLGMIAALDISFKRQMITIREFEKAVSLFDKLGYSLKAKGFDIDKVVKDIKSDKKMEAGIIKFILLDGIGNAVISKDVSDEEIKEAIKVIYG